MEKKSEDIRLYAKLGFLVYADGYTAKIAGMKPGQDQQGRSTWDFTLDPSDEMIKRYNLKPNRQENMLYQCQLPHDLVIQLNPDPAWTRWFYLRTYDGSENYELQKLEGMKDIRELMNLRNQLRMMTMRLDASEEQINLMKLNMPKYMELNFKPIIEQLTPILEKVLKKNE